MPSSKDIRWIRYDKLLTFGEIARIAGVLASLGIEKIRITGGEPLLRDKLETLVQLLSQIKGIKSIDMTTNGWFLSLEKAILLRRAGLQGVTLSLHSLQKERFARISGVDGLQRVIGSIDAARKAGLFPVKVNTVAIRRYNDDEIMDIVEFARNRSLSLRFIEFMPLDGQNIWDPEMIMSGRQILEIISKHYKLKPKGRTRGDTATLYEFDDNKGDIGLITPISDPFCDDCDRIRLTADGKLLTCLFDSNYYDLKPFVRKKHEKAHYNRNENVSANMNINSGNNHNGIHKETINDGDGALAYYITRCLKQKPPGIAYAKPLTLEKLGHKPRPMHAIGG